VGWTTRSGVGRKGSHSQGDGMSARGGSGRGPPHGCGAPSLPRGRSRRLVGCASAGLQRIEPFAAQPKRCYRCLMLGHATSCGSPDRGRRCFRCAGPHLASECRSWTLKCPLCADFGHPDCHVLRVKACPPPGTGVESGPTWEESRWVSGGRPFGRSYQAGHLSSVRG